MVPTMIHHMEDSYRTSLPFPPRGLGVGVTGAQMAALKAQVLTHHRPGLRWP